MLASLSEVWTQLLPEAPEDDRLGAPCLCVVRNFQVSGVQVLGLWVYGMNVEHPAPKP